MTVTPRGLWANSGNPVNGEESSPIGWVPGTNGSPQYLEYYYGFDIGYAAVVTGLRISKAADGSGLEQFSLQQSMDNITWAPLGPQHENVAGTIWFTAMPMKYLRVAISQLTESVGARFALVGCSGQSKCLASPSVSDQNDCYPPGPPVGTPTAVGSTLVPTPSTAPCNDDWQWRSIQGLCYTYASDDPSCTPNPANCNHAFCSSDTDTVSGEVASVACAKSCGTCS